MKKLALAVGIVGSWFGGAQAAGYTWLANPENGNWLGSANWASGEWTADASNTAAFDASSVTDVTVNGDVAVAGITVRNAAYTFTNGTITVNGEFGVGAGATAIVHSTLLGTSTDKRFVKAGSGTLIVKGDASTTNTFARFATRGGTMILDGGVTRVTGASSGAGETQVAGSFANTSRLELTGGAELAFTATSSYLSNSGCNLVISDGYFDCWGFNEFLNGFSDTNPEQAKIGKITIRDKGVMRAKGLRISKVDKGAAYWTPDYGTINVETGGVLRVHDFSMDGGTSRKTATTNFNVSVYQPILSGAAADGGVMKLGAGTLTLQGKNTYNGPTCVEGGTLAFEKAENFPGGHLDFSAAALMAKKDATPYVTAPELVFKDGSKVRIRNSAELSDKTFGSRRVLATTTTPFAKVPELVLLDAEGNELPSSAWGLSLSSDGKTLYFAPNRGTVFLFR